MSTSKTSAPGGRNSVALFKYSSKDTTLGFEFSTLTVRSPAVFQYDGMQDVTEKFAISVAEVGFPESMVIRLVCPSTPHEIDSYERRMKLGGGKKRPKETGVILHPRS